MDSKLKNILSNLKNKFYRIKYDQFYKRKYFLGMSYSKELLLHKLIEFEICNLKCNILASSLHKDTFKKYKNSFANRDVVLLCTGPSAKKYVPLKNVINVGVNGAIYFENILLDYYFIQDYTKYQKNNSQLNIDANNYVGNNCKKFYGIIPDCRSKDEGLVNLEIRRIPAAYSNVKNVSNYILEEKACNNFAYDLAIEPMGDFCGTPFSAMQFILYCNPAKIYLVGCDCSSGYFYKKDSLCNMNYQIESWKRLKEFQELNYPDVEIISINPVGLKGLFKDEYQ